MFLVFTWILCTLLSLGIKNKLSKTRPFLWRPYKLYFQMTHLVLTCLQDWALNCWHPSRLCSALEKWFSRCFEPHESFATSSRQGFDWWLLQALGQFALRPQLGRSSAVSLALLFRQCTALAGRLAELQGKPISSVSGSLGSLFCCWQPHRIVKQECTSLQEFRTINMYEENYKFTPNTGNFYTRRAVT